MILCIDIGNTQIHLGVFENREIKLQFRKSSRGQFSSDEIGVFIKTSLKENNIDPSLIKEISICSVVPDVLHSMVNGCLKYFKVNPFVLKPGVKTSLKIKYRNPLEVGTDRIANAIAASKLFPDKNIIVVDFGTATTFDVITKNKEYLGGIIIPGFRLSMESLNKNTAQLPNVEIFKPKNVVGRSTEESIRSGLYFGQKAIVLTFDNYHSVADNMIASYELYWKNNPFVFRVPYQSNNKYLKEKYGNKIELVKTKKGIKDTIFTLIDDLNENDWIYWCMDDRYPIELLPKDILKSFEYVKNKNFDGLSFTLSLKDRSIKYSHIYSKNVILPSKLKLFKKKHYGSIWSHQFLKVKVLRSFFDNMPNNIQKAKEMDNYLLKVSVLPKQYHLYVTTSSLGLFGESTSRGKLTLNCYSSMIAMDIAVPNKFEITEKKIIYNSDLIIKNPFWWRVKDIIKNI